MVRNCVIYKTFINVSPEGCWVRHGWGTKNCGMFSPEGCLVCRGGY